MRRIASRILTTLSVAGYLTVIGASSGCNDQGASDAPLDAETKKVDQNIQDNMKSFMQSKTQPQGKTSK
ncbi:MAG: hypothetical protein ACYC61_29980 [Isosphaeraceae bacterium]